jgi:hypothetical protein
MQHDDSFDALWCTRPRRAITSFCYSRRILESLDILLESAAMTRACFLLHGHCVFKQPFDGQELLEAVGKARRSLHFPTPKP